jgi:mannose-6-phosphate isomerase-like protein (cupin superfamily)
MFPLILPHVKPVRVVSMTPLLVRPGEGEVITDRDSRHLSILCDLPALSVSLIQYAAGERGPDLHIHRRHTDAFYVLEGTLTAVVGPGGAQRLDVPAGSLVLVPSNVVHTFWNEGPDDMSVLNLHAPAGGFNEMLRGSRDGVPNAHDAFDSFDPPPDGGRSAEDAVVSLPGEGETVEPGGSTLLFKAQATDGDGSLTVADLTLEPDFPAPPLHVHRGFADCFYVVEGSLGLRFGRETVEAGAGTFAVAPLGTAHTFWGPGSEPARVVSLMAPGGFEEYIKEIWADGVLPEASIADEITSRADVENF